MLRAQVAARDNRINLVFPPSLAPDFRTGSIKSFWRRADDFRSTPINRHFPSRSACLKRAQIRTHSPKQRDNHRVGTGGQPCFTESLGVLLPACADRADARRSREVGGYQGFCFTKSLDTRVVLRAPSGAVIMTSHGVNSGRPKTAAVVVTREPPAR
jgi:hypothetical protein